MEISISNFSFKLIFLLIIVFLTTSSFATSTKSFKCEQVFPLLLQVSHIKHCNSTHVEKLPDPSKIGKTNFNNQLFAATKLNNNLGGIKVSFNSKIQKVIYRSAYLATSPMCIQSLARNNVKTIINLYSGNLGYAKDLLPLEKKIALSNKITDYINIEGFMVNSLELSKDALNRKIASILHSIESAKGNVLIHCYTGEHDTGVIFGILNKCYNHQSLKAIKNNTMCHMETKSSYGYKTTMRAIHIINTYPCASSA